MFVLPACLLFLYCYQSLEAVRYLGIHPRFSWVNNPLGSRGMQPLLIPEFFARAFWSLPDLLTQSSQGCFQAGCSVYDFLQALPRWIIVVFSCLTMALLLLPARRHKSLLVVYVWAAAVVIPIPLLASEYFLGAQWHRFYYFPAMPMAALWAHLMQCGLQKLKAGFCKRGTRLSCSLLRV
jgi:hypothetical protein